jgi:hypothetical protein
MARQIPPPDTRDAQIRKLKEELWAARHAIVEIMPAPLREPLEATFYCQSIKDVYEWQRWAIQKIMEQATELLGQDVVATDGQMRAYCPLCRGGSLGPYAAGFAVPIGMQRHLEGSHGSRQCVVLAAAKDACLTRVDEEAEPGYRGPNLQAFGEGTPPWKISPEPRKPSAKVINFPGK